MNSKPMRYLLSIFLALCTMCAFAQKKKAPPFVKPLPVPHRAVNDFGKFINDSERTYLEKELVNYNLRTGNAIVFISLESLTDPKSKKEYTIEEAANLYFNTWGIGDSIKNNGVLLMVTKNPRRVRIEVGKGLETILTNRVCQKIIDDKLVPNFKQGLYFTGIKEGVEGIEYYLDHQPATAAQQTTPAYYPQQDSGTDEEEKSAGGIALGLGIVFGLVFLIFWWARKQAKRFGGWFTGGGYRRGYHRRGYYNDSFNNNNNTYNNNNFFSGGSNRSSGGGRSSSSSSSSSGSYGGGSSKGGGASGGW